MPHVEVIGAAPLAEFHARFQPRSIREPAGVMKALACFLASDGQSALIECVTVEGRLNQGFYALVTTRPGSVMVRLLPRTSPEKTLTVRRLIAWIARWIEAGGGAGASIGTTNLREILESPFPPEATAP